MIASLFTGVVGFVFAFIANAKNTEVAGIINFNPDVSICGRTSELSIPINNFFRELILLILPLVGLSLYYKL